MALTNIFTRFAALYKKDLIVGTVISTDIPNGTTTLQDLTGLTFIAYGTSVAAPNKAYVKNGLVQSQAPTIAQSGDQLV